MTKLHVTIGGHETYDLAVVEEAVEARKQFEELVNSQSWLAFQRTPNDESVPGQKRPNIQVHEWDEIDVADPTNDVWLIRPICGG